MSLLNTMGFATTVVLLICPCLGGKVTSGTESDALMADKLFLKFPTIYQVGAPKEPQLTNTLTNQGVANASQSWNDTVLVNGSTLTTPATTLDVEGGPISMSMSLSLTTATPKNNLISLDRPNFAVNAISSASSKPPMYIGSEAMYRKTKRNQTPHFGLRDNVASVSIIGKLSRNSIVAKETISNSLVLEQNTGSNSFVDGGSSSWRSFNSGQELNMNTQYTSGLVQLAHLEQSTGSSGPSGTLEKSVRRNVQSGNTEKIVGNSGNSGQPYENNAQSGKLEQSTRRNVQTGRLAQLIGGNAVLLNTEQFNNATTPSLNPNQPIHGNTRVLLPVHEPYVNTSALPSKTVRPSYIPLQTLNPNTPVKASVHAMNQGQSADVIAMPGITRQSAKNYINGNAQVVSTGPDVNTGAAIISAESLTASTTRGNTLQSVNTAQSGNSERSIQSTMPPVTTSNPKILSNSQEEEKNLKFENEEKSVILKLLNGYRKAVDSSLMYALGANSLS